MSFFIPIKKSPGDRSTGFNSKDRSWSSGGKDRSRSGNNHKRSRDGGAEGEEERGGGKKHKPNSWSSHNSGRDVSHNNGGAPKYTGAIGGPKVAMSTCSGCGGRGVGLVTNSNGFCDYCNRTMNTRGAASQSAPIMKGKGVVSSTTAREATNSKKLSTSKGGSVNGDRKAVVKPKEAKEAPSSSASKGVSLFKNSSPQYMNNTDSDDDDEMDGGDIPTDDPSEESSGSEGDSDASQDYDDIPTDDPSDEDDDDDESDSEGEEEGEESESDEDDNKNLSFAERAALKRSGDDSMDGRRGNGSRGGQVAGLTNKRTSKSAPMVQSSKKTVSRYREIEGLPSIFKPRDPRFGTISGKYDENAFKARYKFLDAYRDEEITRLKGALKAAEKTGDAEEQYKVQSELSRLQGKKTRDEKAESFQRTKSMLRKAEREKVKEGKKPFFHKRSEIKKLELKDKFEALSKAGKLESFMAKKRKKNANKDHRWLPSRRGGGADSAV
jgi:ribosomal RNA-processing protein 36